MNTGNGTPRFQTLKSQVKLGNGQQLGFTKGRGYYARTAPVSRPTQQQPQGLQPLSGAEIANRIAGYVNALPAPMTDAQIQAKAQGMLDPIVQAITGQITAGEKAGAGAISGYASELAKNLAPYAGQAQQIYGNAQASQAAADSAESQALKTGGTSLAQGLSADLSQMAGPAGLNAAVAAPVATTGANAGTALLGTGSSFLDNLIAQGASATSLAAKQPGIAGLRGLQDISNLSLSSQKQLADALSQEQQQVPGLVQNLETQSSTDRSNRAAAAEKMREYYGARNDAILGGREKNAATVAAANQKAAEAKYAVDTRAATSQYATEVRAQTAQEAAASRASQNDFSNRLKFAKTYGYDPVTNEPLPGYSRDKQGHIVKTSTVKGSAPKPPTVSQVTKLVQQWHDGKTVSTTKTLPNPDSNDNPVTRSVKSQVGQVSYTQAYRLLRTYGVPDTQARAVLNTEYGRGDQGRSWLTNTEQAALKKAGKQTTPGFYQGHAFIAAPQVAALRKAGMLPAGELVNGRYFIKPGG